MRYSFIGSSSSWFTINSSSSFSSFSSGRLWDSSSPVLPFLRLRRSSSVSPSPALFTTASPISFATLSPSSSSSLLLYLTWSTRNILPRTVDPPKLSTARSVLRWSSYFRNANPRLFPVSLSRTRFTWTGSPYCEKIVTMSPSERSNGRPPM